VPIGTSIFVTPFRTDAPTMTNPNPFLNARIKVGFASVLLQGLLQGRQQIVGQNGRGFRCIPLLGNGKGQGRARQKQPPGDQQHGPGNDMSNDHGGLVQGPFGPRRIDTPTDKNTRREGIVNGHAHAEAGPFGMALPNVKIGRQGNPKGHTTGLFENGRFIKGPSKALEIPIILHTMNAGL